MTKIMNFFVVESESYIFSCPGFPEGCMDWTSDPRSPSSSDAYQVNDDDIDDGD